MIKNVKDLIKTINNENESDRFAILLYLHKIALNKGKYHLDYENKTKVLTDYSKEGKIIP
ncbi:hypothetical protein UT300005_34640 [Clostridium sp. CTA-5]